MKLTLLKWAILLSGWQTAAVLILWFADPWVSLSPSQGVRDCLGQEINHFLVAPVSQHTTHKFFKISQVIELIVPARLLFPSFMIIFVWFCILISPLCLIKVCEIVSGRLSKAPTRLGGGGP
jgi:hypothetical protein